MSVIRIATRKSPLALWQARFVKAQIESRLAISCTLVPLSTTGDEILHRPLADVGGKGLFIKRLEEALLRDEADIAVHSMKDVPAVLEDAFYLPAMLPRETVSDVLITREPIQSLKDLKSNAKIGTSSYRRQAQLKTQRPDWDYYCIRGNVETRLYKMEAEHFDGIVLAKAGIDRLGIAPPHVFEIPLQLCWPAAGQGAIGIECLSQRSDLIAQLAALDHADTSHCVQAERAFVRGLQGDCHSPIACLARMKNQMVVLNGHVVSPNGHERVEGVDQGPAEDAVMIGTRLAETLLQQGARKILDVPYDTVRSHLQF